METTKHRWLLWIFTLLLTACSSGAGSTATRIIRPLQNGIWNSNGLVPVPGILSAVRHSADPVRVLVVHGMKTNSPKYSATLQEQIVARLGWSNSAGRGPVSEAVITLQRGYDVTVISGSQPLNAQPRTQIAPGFETQPPGVQLPSSTIRKTVWRGKSGDADLEFYEVLWAPLRDRVKETYLSCFEGADAPAERCPTPAAAQNKSRRNLANRAIKDEIVVGGLADATIVLGGVGDVLRDDLELAFCHIMVDILSRKGLALDPIPNSRCDVATAVEERNWPKANVTLDESRFVALTHSLGSFFIMDAQRQAMRYMNTDWPRQQDAKETRRARLFQRSAALFHLLEGSAIFMRANQISLLELGRLSAICEPHDEADECPNRRLQTTDQWLDSEVRSAMTPMTFYVAFNDADDLLGFELPPYLAETGELGTMVNVTVRNPAFRIPWLFAHPSHVHNRSDENSVVIGHIVNGIQFIGPGTAMPP